MEIIVGIPFTLIGLLFLFLTGISIHQSIRRLRDWELATGRVVGFDESNRAGRRFYRPQVEFAAADGRTVVFAASIGSNRRPYRIGDCVNVLVDPANPERADLRSFSALWLPTVFFSLFGLVSVGLGVYLIFRGAR